MEIFDYQEFGLSVIAYLNYVERKQKRDSAFDPHPLIKALNCAFADTIKLRTGETVMGVSGDANRYPDDSPRESYCVVIRKEDVGFTLLAVKDISIGKDVPLESAIFLILISMKMDKYDGLNISVNEAITIINTSLPEINIIRFNNSEWKEARDSFKKTLQDGKFKIFEDIFTEELQKEFLEITYDTPWEEYAPRIRSMIANNWLMKSIEDKDKLSEKDNIVFSSIDDEMPKYKIMQFVREILYGRSSEYFERNKPSINPDVSYSNNSNKNVSTKVERNKPCPCGSGKKYKKCCGRNN